MHLFTMTPELWAIAIQTAGLVVTLVVMHNQNIQRMADIQTKVGLMWRAFERKFHFDDHQEPR